MNSAHAKTVTELADRIVNIFRKLGIEAEGITPSTRPKKDLGMDSVDMVDVIVAIEKEFGVSLDDKQVMACDTILDIAVLVETLQTR